MDSCIVCLTNRDMSSRIRSKSLEWQEGNIQRVIEKHLWWWYSKTSPTNHLVWICRQCWQALLSFHTFYTRVEKVHQQYELMKGPTVEETVFTVTKEPKINRELLKANIEAQFFEYDSTTSDEVLTTDKIIQGHKSNIKKLSDNLKTGSRSELDHIEFVREDNHLSNNEDSNIENDMELLVPKEEHVIWISSSPSLDESLMSVKVCGKEGVMKYDNKLPKESHRNLCADIRKNKYTKSKTPKVIDSYLKSKMTRETDEYLGQSEYKFSCHLCKISLTDFRDLKTHFRLEHQSQGYALCCNKKFYNRGQLADHLRVHKDPNYFKCPQCDRILAHRLSFENHMKYHYQSPESRYSCGKCEKVFFIKSVYERHLLTHLPDEEHTFQLFGYDDNICGIELSRENIFNPHKKKICPKAKQQNYICPFCWKVSPTKPAQRQHIRYVHTMKRNYACNMCERKFRRALELKEHISTHTGEPLYTCSYCTKTFYFSGNMHKHLKSTHPMEWQENRVKTQRILS